MSPRRASRRSAAILTYHSIADVERDPFAITVAPADFEGHVDVLARHFNVLTLGQLTEGLDRGDLPDRAVGVTFDDGYANNLGTALPILAAHGVPATLFVATGYIGTDREFWWDEVARLIWIDRGGDAPPVLELEAGGDSLRCAMDDQAAAVRRITLWLQGRPPGSVEEGLLQVRRWAGLDGAPAARPTHRPLTHDELRTLAASPVIEIGAHTRSHLRLGAQDPGVQGAEIQGSRDDLVQWLGTDPVGFAYPFGTPGTDYSAQTVALVAAAGFGHAVSGRPELARRSSPRHELPRWFVTTPRPQEFQRWLTNRFRPLPVRAAGKLARRARHISRGG